MLCPTTIHVNALAMIHTLKKKENPTFIRSYINHLVEVSCILSFRLVCDVVHECTLSCSQSTFTFKKENWVRVKKYIEPKLGENEK